jgi:hypothetical protein
MIDFNNASFIKLNEVDNKVGQDLVGDQLVDGEQLLNSFKGIRDMVVFTSKRIIAINVQGLSGKKKDFTSLPYSKIQAFSVESAGTFDRDAELELWFSGLGKVKFEFSTSFDIKKFNKLIGSYVL